MRKNKKKTRQVIETSRTGRMAAVIVRHPREFVGIMMAAAATIIIFTNALFLQAGPHPAPIFAARAPLRPAAPQSMPVQVQVQPAQPQKLPANAPAEAAQQNKGQLVADIQRELSRRGFYDGAVDGLWGARTDAAVRDFVQAAGLKIDTQASDVLLRAIVATPVRRAAPEPARSNDPIAELIAPSKRILAVQHALADFGYGQIKPTGVYDPATRVAIEKFERDHRLPVMGQISDRVVRELAAMTGRPLE